MDFRDCRSRKVVLVPHCALNQNARSPTTAKCPAAELEFVAGLIKRGIGIVQMPCPELLIISLGRTGGDIRTALDTLPARAACREMSKGLAYQIQQYLSCGMSVLGVFGKGGSPSCGVETTYYDGKIRPGKGIFIEELQAEFEQWGLRLPMVGYQDNQPEVNLSAVDRWAEAAEQ